METLDVAIVGAGPYGLSLGAHLAGRARARVFGEPMRTWRTMMPPEMLLRSHWEETKLSCPGDRGTLQRWSEATGEARREPVPLSAFLRYADWFRESFVPESDPADVVRAEIDGDRFRVHTSAGEELAARRLVLALGVTPFPRRLPALDGIDDPRVSFAIEHREFGRFAGRRVLVVGGGQNGLESAALAAAAGAASTEIVVRSTVRWFRTRERWEQRGGLETRLFRLAYPIVGFGPPPINRLVLHPDLFATLPVAARDRLSRRLLRPGGSPWVRDQVVGHVRISEGLAVEGADSSGDAIRLRLSDGSEREVDAVVVCVGYRFDLRRLTLLEPALRDTVHERDGWPVLDRAFRSTNPRLQLVGYAAERRFGPLSRFVAGTTFTAERACSVLDAAA